MRFLNYFSVLCCKTLPCYVKVQCRHYVLLRQTTVNALNRYEVPYFHKESFSKIHCSGVLCAKSYRETENEYAHEVLQTTPSYSESTVKQPTSVKMEDFSECNEELNKFAKVTIHCMSQNITLEDGPFSLPVSRLIESLSTLSDENLLKCLFLLCCLPPAPKTWTPNFKALWNSLDSECVRRLHGWDTPQKLLVADYWFHLRLNRISQYNRKMIEDLLNRLNTLTNAEVVQLMFYINLQRELMPESLRGIERKLAGVVKAISIDELGVTCLGFFKTKNRINDISTIKLVIERFMEEVAVARLATIVSLLKFLKKSMNLYYTEIYIPLLHKCIPHTCKWDVHACIHLALLASECHVHHPLLLDSVTRRVHELIETARLKDLMKLMQCLAHFNHRPPEKFTGALFSELWNKSRQSEVDSQPRVLIYIALYYSYLGHYNYDLLNIVLDAEFAQKCISVFPETEMTFAEVDCSTEIECKDYAGNRLGRSVWKVLNKRRGSVDMNSKKPNASVRLLRDILSVFGSKENIQVRHILPHHFLPDIIIEPPGGQKSSDQNFLFSPPEGQTWVCLVIGVPYSFLYRSKHITGVTAMKLRQLESLGYKTVLIPYYELPRDFEKRKKYLQNRLRCYHL